jgi:hypothetical protein
MPPDIIESNPDVIKTVTAGSVALSGKAPDHNDSLFEQDPCAA